MRGWRLLDTGARTAAENIALDQILLELRSKSRIPNTLRFLKFNPPAVLVGYHQAVENEVRVEYCRAEGIEINRRITGGGAIYFDSTQLGWELIGERGEFGWRLDTISERIVEGICLGLRKIGINAAFRGRNDIEVDGRKISGTGGVFEGDTFLFQGTLLIDFDIERMIKALKIPVEKLASKEIDSARERVTWVKRELGKVPPLKEIKKSLLSGLKEVLGIEFFSSPLLDEELTSLRKKVSHFQSKEWIEGVRESPLSHQIVKASYKADGGLVKIQSVVDLKRQRVKELLITGDFFISPRRAIFDLEATLKNTPFHEVRGRIERFFMERKPLMSLSPEDFAIPISEAIERATYTKLGFSIDEANDIFPVNGSLMENVSKGRLLLLPYCAKLIGCEYRYQEGCDECGECSVGEAYKLAKRHNMRPLTVQNYNHLREILNRCEMERVAYIGCCCESFFNKRQSLFRDTKVAGVLIDIDDTTCFDLSLEREALDGKFEGQTTLKLSLIHKVLKLRGNG